MIKRFEAKAIVVFTLIITLCLSAINIVNLLSYKKVIEDNIGKEVSLYYTLFKMNPQANIPDHIKISESFVLDDRYELITIAGRYYIFIDKSFKVRKLKSLAVTLFLWEVALVLSSILIIYMIIIKQIKHEEYIRKYLEIIVMAISHKFGNFLSMQRVNVELIKDKCKHKAVERLENAHLFMEKDFKALLRAIKRISSLKNYYMERVNVKHIVEDTIKHFEPDLSNKKLKLRLHDVYVTGVRFDIENIIFSVLENAVRFSRKYVYVKLCKKGNRIYLIILNDIGKLTHGSGIGLKVAESLLSNYGGEIRTRRKKNFLTVVSFLA